MNLKRCVPSPGDADDEAEAGPGLPKGVVKDAPDTPATNDVSTKVAAEQHKPPSETKVPPTEEAKQIEPNTTHTSICQEPTSPAPVVEDFIQVNRDRDRYICL